VNSDSNTTTVTGDILAAASIADQAVYFNNSDSNIVNLTGSIKANQATADVIVLNSSSDNNTINLTLNAGDTLVGNILDNGSGNTLNININNTTRSGSYIYTSSGSGDLTWNITDPSKPFVNGSAKSRGIADIDDAANRLYQRFNLINDRLTHEQRQVAQG